MTVIEMGKISEYVTGWPKRNAKASKYVGAGAAGATALHLGLDSRVFDGQSIYDMTNSATRFAPYIGMALAFGKAVEITMEGQKGKPLSLPEKLGAYTIGALGASGLCEGWEVFGSSGAIHNALHSVVGNYAKQDFVGKGSLSDMAATVAGTDALVAGKEYVSGLMRRTK